MGSLLTGLRLRKRSSRLIAWWFMPTALDWSGVAELEFSALGRKALQRASRSASRLAIMSEMLWYALEKCGSRD
jgi:hypothetical protein